MKQTIDLLAKYGVTVVRGRIWRLESMRRGPARRLWPCVVCFLLAGLWPGSGLFVGQANATQGSMVKAREALGGDAAIAGVKSLVLYGTVLSGFDGITAQPLNTPKTLEIRILLPTHYMRIERDSRQEHRMGFRGGSPFVEVEAVSPDVRVSASSRPPGPDVLSLFQQYLARLLLGMLGDAKDIAAVKASRSPGSVGRSDAIAFAGPNGFAATVDIDTKSALPLRVRYVDDVRYPVALTDQDRAARRMPGPWTVERVEVTISFEDRRLTGSLLLPYLIRQTAAGRRFEEIRFDRIVVNPSLTAADFGRQD